jgi:hypothetical protein
VARGPPLPAVLRQIGHRAMRSFGPRVHGCSLRLLKRQGFDARSWLGRFSPDWAKCHKLIDAGLVASREFQPKPQMRNDFSRSQIAALAVMTARLVLLARLL